MRNLLTGKSFCVLLLKRCEVNWGRKTEKEGSMGKRCLIVIVSLLVSLSGVPAYAIDIGGVSFGPDDVLPVAESEGSVGPIQSEEFGTATTSILNLGPCEMMPRSAADFTTVDATSCTSIGVLSGQARVSTGAEVHLPNGVQITEITLYYNDTHPTSNPSTGLWRVSTTGAATGVQFVDPGAFSAGDTSLAITLDTPHTVDNTANKYVYLGVLDRVVATPAEQERIYRVAIKYRRQISPAPGTATFPTDVPTTHPFFRFVEALAGSGVTGGCGAGAYCPDQAVTRGQMAVFLSTALGLHWPD